MDAFGASGATGGEQPASSAAGDAGRQGLVSGPRSLRRALKRLNARRRWGYWVWGLAAGVIVIPELIAAFGAGWLPFTTISKMTGHLERRHSVLELVVVALVVWVVYSTVRIPPRTRSGKARLDNRPHPVRTSGGRLTLHAPTPRPTKQFDDDDAPRLFVIAATASLAAIALAGFAVAN